MTEIRPASFFYVMFPTDFFRRPAVIKMIQRWERSIEWTFFLVSIAREAQAGGKLVLGGQPVTIDDLTLLHRNSISPEFIDYVIQAGWFFESDGIIQLSNPSDWYRPKSKEPDSERERSAARRATAGRPQATALDRTKEKRREENIREDPPYPQTGDGEGQISTNGTSKPDDPGLSVRLKSLERLEKRMGRPLKRAEKRQAVNVLSKPAPAGIEPSNWHSYLLTTLSDHLKRVFDEAQGGRGIGSAVSVACCRAEEQITAHLITNQAAN